MVRKFLPTYHNWYKNTECKKLFTAEGTTNDSSIFCTQNDDIPTNVLIFFDASDPFKRYMYVTVM